MRPAFFAAIIWLSAFINPSQRAVSSKPFRLESPKVVVAFTTSMKNFDPSTSGLKFTKTVKPFDPGTSEVIITFSSNGNEIQYYKSDSTQFLYRCKVSSPAIIAAVIPFLLKEKSELISKKYWQYNKVNLEYRSNLEELELVFKDSKIARLNYAVHPHF